MKVLILSPRAFAWVLFLSLVLNAFLLAWIGVGWFRPKPHSRFALAAFEERFASRLPEPDALLFRAALEGHRAELSARMDAARRGRDGVREALAADPFERPRLEAAFRDSHEAMTRFYAEFHSVILDLAPRLSPEGRRRLFARRFP